MRISVSAESRLAAVVSHPSLPLRLKLKQSRPRQTDDSDLVFFDIKLDSVTLTEPGLAVLAVFLLNLYMCNYVEFYMCTCGLCNEPTNMYKMHVKFIHMFVQGWRRDSFCSLYAPLIFLRDYFQHSFLGFHFLAIFSPKGMHHYQMAVFSE